MDIQVPKYNITPVVIPANGQIIDWGNDYLGVEDAYTRSRGHQAVVWVLDTGIDPNHPDLIDRLILELCSDFTKSPNSWRDVVGHGTHVAGIIAASDNHIGVRGVAPETDLVAVKVLNDSGAGAYSWIANGIRYAADNAIKGKANIINMSLSGRSPDPDLLAAIDYAINQGCIVLAAAGNNGYTGNDSTIGYPALYNQVITVASIDENGQPSIFSSGGDALDIAAPGDGIFSTHLNKSYALLSGTSMATPYAAGVLALLAAIYPKLRTNDKDSSQQETPQSFADRLLRRRVTDLFNEGFDTYTGHGTPIVGPFVPQKQQPTHDHDNHPNDPTPKNFFKNFFKKIFDWFVGFLTRKM